MKCRRKQLHIAMNYFSTYNLDVIEGMRLAIGYIVGRPTAYDPDKVIEKLQVLSDKADDDIAVCEEDTCQYYDGYGDGLDRAIEIVKSEWE